MGGKYRAALEGVHGSADLREYKGDESKIDAEPGSERCSRFRGGLEGGGLGRLTWRLRLLPVVVVDMSSSNDRVTFKSKVTVT